MKRQQLVRSKLQFKLISVIVVAFGMTLAAGTFVLLMSIDQPGKLSIQRQIDEENEIIKQQFEEIGAELIEIATFVSQQPPVREGFAQQDQAAVQAYIGASGSYLDHDLVWAVDTRNRVMGVRFVHAEFNSITHQVALNYNDQPNLSILHIDHGPVLAASMPVFDSSAQLIGHIVVADVINSVLLGRLNFGRGSMALVVFADDLSTAGVSANEANGEPHLSVNQVELLRLEPSLLERIRGGETIHMFDVTVRGTPHAVIYQPMYIASHFWGYYAIAVDENDLRAIQNNVLIVALGTLFVVLILSSTLIAASIHHLVIQPLGILSQTVRLIEGGQLNARLTVTGSDEFARLSATFNAMATSIETRTYELNTLNRVLEERVIERTAQLAQQTTWLETIVCKAREAVIVTDDDGIVRLINEVALASLDLKESEALGMSLLEIFENRAKPLIRLSNHDEDIGQVEMQGRFYRYAITRIKSDDTNPGGHVLILSDITSLHRLNALKTQVIRMAAHDLRIPLTALRLQHYMLQKQGDSLTELQCKTLQHAEASVLDMQNLIDSLLNLEHIERQAQGSREAVAMGSLLLSGISLMSNQMKLKNQHLELDIAEDIPAICGDPVRLFEAVRNYLANAVKYTPDGGHIAACVYADTQYVHLEVRDTGIEIDPDDLDRLFEPRFRAKTALATEEEGQGIGLSLVKEIVEEHGGWVAAKSQPGSGSTFILTIPIQSTC